MDQHCHLMVSMRYYKHLPFKRLLPQAQCMCPNVKKKKSKMQCVHWKYVSDVKEAYRRFCAWHKLSCRLLFLVIFELPSVFFSAELTKLRMSLFSSEKYFPMTIFIPHFEAVVTSPGDKRNSRPVFSSCRGLDQAQCREDSG